MARPVRRVNVRRVRRPVRRRTITGFTSTIAEMAQHAFVESRAVEIARVPIEIDSLPDAFEGLTVAQISDVHHSSFMSAERIAEIVDAVNGLGADVVVLTGDYVSYSPYYIAGAAEALGRLRAPQGVFAVLGNHDFWNNADEVTRALAREGIEVLRNAHTRLESRGDAVVLAGIDDLTVRAADLDRALRGADPRRVRLLLSHNPGIVRRAALRAVDLVLAGHTHGGQVHVPLIGAPSVYGYPKQYVRGLARLGGTQIYVNRGLGTVIVPVRVGSCPEISVFTLRRSREQLREAS
jgi:predicted MPP superfamily phosphohydrolase